MVRHFVPPVISKKETKMSIPMLRGWQEDATTKLLDEWRENTDSKPLISACPGAGKTIFSVNAAVHAFKDFGVELVVVVVPSVNLKEQWRDSFKTVGIHAHAHADNDALRFRVQNNTDPTDGWKVICVTYAQLASDADLFVEIARRKKTLVVADEVHHSDDQKVYGDSLSKLAEQAHLRLSLSGTPFNTQGGALAMCETVVDVDPDTGFDVRVAKALHSYSYGSAVYDQSCRPVEFINLLGNATATYQSLTDGTTFEKTFDLENGKERDSIAAFLDPRGQYFEDMATQALTALEEIKRSDKKAGMLVVAKDRAHGNQVYKKLAYLCRAKSEWSNYQLCEIYNDTPKAHGRIKQLNHDNTDIVVTVRMISEGVDVKRLRVGLYATDYRTRMFFIQYIGRFVRWESRLDDSQYAKVVIPAHPALVRYAVEIEEMINEALIKQKGKRDSTDTSDAPMVQCVDVKSESTSDTLIYRGEKFSDRELVSLAYEACPSIREKCLPESIAILIAQDLQKAGVLTQAASVAKSNSANVAQVDVADDGVDYHKLNDQLVRRIGAYVKKRNPTVDEKDYFRQLQFMANKAVGIKKKDSMTPVEKLKERHKWLSDFFKRIIDEDKAAASVSESAEAA